MVYRFKIVSEEVDGFYREIEIDSEATFFQLRDAILDSVGYSHDGMDSFYICDEDWNRHEQIVIEDFGSASDEDVWLMDQTHLDELLEDKGQHLAFIFDNLSERAFFMALSHIDMDDALTEPQCTVSKGNPPKRSLDIDQVDALTEKKTAAINTGKDDFDLSDLYGSGNDGYNEEDLMGLDDMNF